MRLFSSVGIVLVCGGGGGTGVDSMLGQEFLFRHSTQIFSGTLTTPYPVVNQGSLPPSGKSVGACN
jgi:hypothetical protein